ncbi:MAG: hypothetical protein ABIT08_12345 [Bacteroidia bacterium]
MITNENMDDELKDAPLLKSMSRENPFKVPDGYFDSFPTIISEKIAAQNSKPDWAIFLQNVFQPKYVVAMLVFAVVLTSGIFYFNEHSKLNQQEMLLSYDDLNNLNYIEQIDESDLIDAYSSVSNSEVYQSSEDNSDIENYLIDNQTDNAIIENEL